MNKRRHLTTVSTNFTVTYEHMRFVEEMQIRGLAKNKSHVVRTALNLLINQPEHARDHRRAEILRLEQTGWRRIAVWAYKRLTRLTDRLEAYLLGVGEPDDGRNDEDIEDGE